MTEKAPSRSLWREILAAGLLAALVFALAAPAAFASLFGRDRDHGFARDPERVRRHAELATRFVLSEVDATPEQTERVQAIVAGALESFADVRAEHEARREALLAELEKPELSRDALQSLRAEELAFWDASSVRLVDALVDAAAVLTLEQREKLVSLAREMHEAHDD